MRAEILTVLAIALVGLFGAVSLGYAAYVVSRDQVGLPGNEAQDAARLPRPHPGEDDGTEAAGAESQAGRATAAASSATEHHDPGAGGRPRLSRRVGKLRIRARPGRPRRLRGFGATWLSRCAALLAPRPGPQSPR